MSAAKASRLGEEVWKTRTEKLSAEVLTLTYGTLVAGLCRDLTYASSPQKTDYAAVNAELDRMGYQIGLRLIEDFLAKTGVGIGQCQTFRETADVIARVGFKVFLNIVPTVVVPGKNTTATSAAATTAEAAAEGKTFRLVFDENPLADFVELPDDGRAQDELWFSNVLCGVIRGALEMVQMQVEARFVSDVLRGNETTEMQVTLIRYIEDEMPPDDE